MIKIENLEKWHEELQSNMKQKSDAISLMDKTLMDKLRIAIMLMKHRGLHEVHAIGGFVKEGIAMPEKGQSIIIPKGAKFHSMKTGPDNIAKINQKVTVHSVTPLQHAGFYEEYRNDPSSIQEFPVEIKWAGSGGYWHTMSLNEWVQHGGPELTEQLKHKLATEAQNTSPSP